MAVFGDDRRSLLEHCRLSAPSFLLSDVEARDIINSQASVIVAGWPELCDEAQLAPVDRAYFWRRQILNNYAFDGYGDGKPAGL